MCDAPCLVTEAADSLNKLCDQIEKNMTERYHKAVSKSTIEANQAVRDETIRLRNPDLRKKRVFIHSNLPWTHE